MSDQQTTTATTAPGQAPKDISNVGQPVQSDYLTREEAKIMVQQAQEEAWRRAQGLVTKRDAAIQQSLKAIQDTIAMQRQAGMEITAEQEQKLKDQAVLKAYQSAPAEEPASQPAQAAPEGEIDPVTAIALGFEKRYGVEIFEGDPEYSLVQVEGDESEYLESYLQAIQAKIARTKGQPTSFRTPTNAGQGGAPATQVRDLKNYREYLRQGLEQP